MPRGDHYRYSGLVDRGTQGLIGWGRPGDPQLRRLGAILVVTLIVAAFLLIGAAGDEPATDPDYGQVDCPGEDTLVASLEQPGYGWEAGVLFCVHVDVLLDQVPDQRKDS